MSIIENNAFGYRRMYEGFEFGVIRFEVIRFRFYEFDICDFGLSLIIYEYMVFRIFQN